MFFTIKPMINTGKRGVKDLPDGLGEYPAIAWTIIPRPAPAGHGKLFVRQPGNQACANPEP